MTYLPGGELDGHAIAEAVSREIKCPLKLAHQLPVAQCRFCVGAD